MCFSNVEIAPLMVLAKVKENCCEIYHNFDLLWPELFVGCVNIVQNIRIKVNTNIIIIAVCICKIFYII